MTAPNTASASLAHSDAIVLDYLAALWAESEDLTPELRDELMTTVADYIAMRRTSPADPIADPEQIVGRLGPPEALVAAVRRGRMPAHLRFPVPAAPRRPRPVPPDAPTPTDYGAIALLTAGSVVLPGLSSLAGMVLVSGSARWGPASKAAAWVLVGGACGLAMLLLLYAMAAIDGFGAAELAYVILVTASWMAGLSLLPGLVSRRR